MTPLENMHSRNLKLYTGENNNVIMLKVTFKEQSDSGLTSEHIMNVLHA